MVGDVFSKALLAAVVAKLMDLVKRLDAENQWDDSIPLIPLLAFGIAIAFFWQAKHIGRELAVDRRLV
jgi:prepilin signal peptidase PulO-like enzyme (type II secretory pathway)